MGLTQDYADTPIESLTAKHDIIDTLLADLERDGAVTLPPLVSADTLAEMQAVFANRLRYMSANGLPGYHRGELYRLTVDNVLTLSQGFVDIGLHSIVTGVISRYAGPHYGLCEAKGWQTQPTSVDFNTWHGDAWYDQETVKDHIPREVKLAFYLSDVRTGAFQYIKGTHRIRAPHVLKKHEGQHLDHSQRLDFLGPAGTAILFDTSGIHRQGVPIVQPRRAVFYNYHDRDIPLQKEDVEYYRYHPLILNAAFLGDLTPEQSRVLGFGQKGRLQLDHVQSPRFPTLHAAATAATDFALRIDSVRERVTNKLGRMLRRSG
jgi:hypothetical protein